MLHLARRATVHTRIQRHNTLNRVNWGNQFSMKALHRLLLARPMHTGYTDQPVNSVQQRMLGLSHKINQCREAYFQRSESLVEDVEYDKMMDELANLEQQYPQWKQPDSPTEAVGAPVGADTIEHKKPMLSLSNTYNTEEVAIFLKRVHNSLGERDVDYITELKFDGVAMSLHYINGKFAHAVTRGDGVRGEDATSAIQRYVPSIPQTLNLVDSSLPEHIEVRGEVIIDEENFNKANSLNPDRKYSTKRNLASGVVNRKKDSTKHTDIVLQFIPYGLVAHDDTTWNINTQWDSLQQLEKLGFEVNQDATLIQPPSVAEKLLTFLSKWEKDRNSLKYDIDGIVIKVNSVPLQEKLGSTGKCPRWATAYKFPPNRFRTKLNDVVMQIGRTGKITPVAVFDTVNIDGIQVQRATLHNKNFIIEYGIDIGKIIIIERSGDVIPKVVGVVDESDPNGEKEPLVGEEAERFEQERAKTLSVLSKFDFCPCTSKYPLTSQEGKAAIFCTNPSCPAQIEGKITHFASKHCLNIEGLGAATVRELVDFEALREVEDIFSLHKWETAMAKIPGWGEKKVSNLLKNIEDRRKNATWAQILASLGIPQVGRELAQQLARDIKNFEALYNMSMEDLTMIERIGNTKAEGIYKFLHSPENRKSLFVLNEILPAMSGSDRKKVETFSATAGSEAAKNSKYAGKLFVFTGTMTSIDRDMAQNYARKLGGDYRTSVTKKIDYLVVGGDGAGESKLEKAQHFGIKIMYEQEFKKIIYDYFGR